MENKLEKYINYIVDDLVKGTKIIFENNLIEVPYINSSSPYVSFSYFNKINSPKVHFIDYVIKKYGSREEELDIIWKRYKERVLSLII